MEPYESPWMAPFQSFESETRKGITKGEINRVYISVPGFPADGLTSKVLFDRIREVAGLIGIIADE